MVAAAMLSVRLDASWHAIQTRHQAALGLPTVQNPTQILPSEPETLTPSRSIPRVMAHCLARIDRRRRGVRVALDTSRGLVLVC